MNKMEYQKPWAEFVQFENEDIITASGDSSISCNNNWCTDGNRGCYFQHGELHCQWGGAMCLIVNGHYHPTPCPCGTHPGDANTHEPLSGGGMSTFSEDWDDAGSFISNGDFEDYND